MSNLSWILLLASILALGQGAPASSRGQQHHYPYYQVAHDKLAELIKQQSGHQLHQQVSVYQQEKQMANAEGLHSKPHYGHSLPRFIEDQDNQKSPQKFGAPWKGKKTYPSRIRNYQVLNKLNELAKEEAFGLGDAARYIADAFSKRTNDVLQPGDFFRIVAKLFDNISVKTGDQVRSWARYLDDLQRASELLGFSSEGKDALKDFDIGNFLYTFAKALDGFDNGDLEVKDLFQILTNMARKVGGDGIQEVVDLIQIAEKLLLAIGNQQADEQWSAAILSPDIVKN